MTPAIRMAAALTVALAMLSSVAATASPRVDFTIGFQGVTTDLPLVTAAVLPGATLAIETQAGATAEVGTLGATGTGWTWVAPADPGLARVTFDRGDQTLVLQVLILTPFDSSKQNRLNGFEIGRYNTTPFRGLSSYAAPKGLVDLAHGTADLRVSPHFTLGQFLCKQQPGHDPTYLLLRPALLIKLEALLEAARARGWDADTFSVMSGFRTPHYNKQIGNKTTSSRHLYGGAADIFIDHDGDGRMDDLNGDGRIDKDDARALAALAEELAAAGGPDWPPGGIGIYGSNQVRGPFVHIDARGYRARWG